MIRKAIVSTILFVFFATTAGAQTWDEWFRQKKTQQKYLLQQIAKLQVYLGFVKKGYDIANKGLTFIGDIKKGDFKLHGDFFNHLKTVSPIIRHYSKVSDIISMQVRMVAAYKQYYQQFRQLGVFSTDEINYLYGVFTTLLDKVADDITDLTNILTNAKMEMTDDERIEQINKLYDRVTEKYSFLYSFGENVKVQATQRKKELGDLQGLKKLYEP
jgi:hypothetical protein